MHFPISNPQPCRKAFALTGFALYISKNAKEVSICLDAKGLIPALVEMAISNSALASMVSSGMRRTKPLQRFRQIAVLFRGIAISANDLASVRSPKSAYQTFLSLLNANIQNPDSPCLNGIS